MFAWKLNNNWDHNLASLFFALIKQSRYYIFYNKNISVLKIGGLRY